MKKSPARRAATPARITNRPSLIPAQLAALLTLIDHRHADEMTRALAAARRTLHDPLRTEFSQDTVWRFIVSEAEGGPWKQLHALIETMEDSRDDVTAGDFVNIYAGPALTIGLALAYVFLLEGGAR